MTETILLLVIVSQLVFIGLLLRAYHTQEKKLIKAIMSKTVEEYTASEIAEKPAKAVKEKAPDLVPLSELDDDQFNKAIRSQLKKD